MNKLGNNAWEGCICMREQYGSLVEFISSYSWGGGFWWDRWEGFWNRQMELMSDRQNKGMQLWWRSTRVGDCWEISKRAKPKLSQRPSGLKKTF